MSGTAPAGATGFTEVVPAATFVRIASVFGDATRVSGRARVTAGRSPTPGEAGVGEERGGQVGDPPADTDPDLEPLRQQVVRAGLKNARFVSKPSRRANVLNYSA